MADDPCATAAGRCAETAPSLVAGPPLGCELQAGHAGMHHDAGGVDWIGPAAAYDPEGIRAWLHDHAYAPDDIVLGNRGLEADELQQLHLLLDRALPGWRDLFSGR